MLKQLKTPLYAMLTFALLGSLTQFTGAQPVEEKEIKASVGDMQFQYTAKEGVTLKIHGIPLLNGSSFWVVKPGWKGQIYGAELNKNIVKEATIENYQGGKKITLHHQQPADMECPFEGTETFILLPDNSYHVVLEGKITRDVPASIEWKAGEINPLLIIGKDYTVTTGEKSQNQKLWIAPRGITYDDGMVGQGFDTLTFQSKLGELSIKTKAEYNIAFFDYRKNRWADPANPHFWMGALERGLKYGTPFHYEIDITFPKSAVPEASLFPVKEIKTPVSILSEAQIPNLDPTYIVPTPKQLTFTSQVFPLSNQTRIYTGKNPGTNMDKTLALFLNELKTNYNITPRVIKDDCPTVELNSKCILMGKASTYSWPADLCKTAGVPVPDHPEGYSIYADSNKVVVAANTDLGLFYGLASLVQMIKVNKEGIFLKGALVRDYPALLFRGVHCFTGKDKGAEISKAVQTLLARNKINSMIWECEYLKWDCCPEIASTDKGMDKKDAEKVLQAAKDNYIEIIPLIQSLGHSEWMFENKQHLDLAEDPQNPYAYCVTNPATYDFIYKVYQEAVDFFQPRYFHIGHDEVNTSNSRFPYRSKDSGKTETEIILSDILRHHDWLKDRKIKLMMWGDMFLYDTEAPDATNAKSLEEAKDRRAKLPKDITITDWHYVADASGNYPSLKILKNEGFDVIGAGWYRADNIRGHAYACAASGVKGYLQTTWAGFNFAIDNNPESWYQYWAYINAAEYSWSGKNTPVNDLPFQAQQIFFNTWFEKKPLLAEKKGFSVDLQDAYNRSLSDKSGSSGWMGLGANEDLSSFPVGNRYFGETQFIITPNARNQAAIMLYGKFNAKGKYPKNVELSLDHQKATELHFLCNAGLISKEGTQIGSIDLVYADGTSEILPLVYGKNIFAYDDIRLSQTSQIAWKGNTQNNKTIAVWDLVWQNPKPAKEIKKIVLRSAGTESCPVFYAITGVN
jgi:hypothetical protein